MNSQANTQIMILMVLRVGGELRNVMKVLMPLIPGSDLQATYWPMLPGYDIEGDIPGPPRQVNCWDATP
jgi:hypothetical protein